MSTATTGTRGGLSAPVLVGGAFVLTTVANLAFRVADIVFTDRDPHRPEGPIESIQSISVAGGLALLIALAIAVPLARDPSRARIGAIVLGALSLVSLPFYWCGAPAIFGACAAWLAGLTRGAHPQTGAARAFGVIGFVVAVLGVVAVFAGSVLGFFE